MEGFIRRLIHGDPAKPSHFNIFTVASSVARGELAA
jgi:hypothetical protein